MTLTLDIIICSTRPGRQGPKVASWLDGFAKQNGKFDVNLIDLAEFNLPVFDEAKHPRLGQYEHAHTKRWSQMIGSADACLHLRDSSGDPAHRLRNWLSSHAKGEPGRRRTWRAPDRR